MKKETVLVALGLGVVMVSLYGFGLIPGWFAVALWLVGGFATYVYFE